MAKVLIQKIVDGKKVVIGEHEISQEKIDAFIDNIGKKKEAQHARIKERFDKIPAIHLEILKYSNTHSKSEVLLEYPKHENFINRIVFN